jgi:hypothetical protein
MPHIVGKSYVACYSIAQHAEKMLTAAALMLKVRKPKIQQIEFNVLLRAKGDRVAKQWDAQTLLIP